MSNDEILRNFGATILDKGSIIDCTVNQEATKNFGTIIFIIWGILFLIIVITSLCVYYSGKAACIAATLFIIIFILIALVIAAYLVSSDSFDPNDFIIKSDTKVAECYQITIPDDANKEELDKYFSFIETDDYIDSLPVVIAFEKDVELDFKNREYKIEGFESEEDSDNNGISFIPYPIFLR